MTSLINDDFEPDDFEPDSAGDDFVADDFEPDTPKFEPKESRPIGQQVGRAILQFGTGAAQGTPVGMVYDIAVAPLSNKDAQSVNYRESVLQDIQDLQEQKQFGEWSEKDQEYLDNLLAQIKDPDKLLEHVVATPDLSFRGLAEKVTGQNLEPESWIERGANWAGFLVGGRAGSASANIGTSPKEIVKALTPTGKEVFRGAGAGAMMQLAHDGGLGPIGTIGAAIVGDIIGHSPKALVNAAKNPKKAIAEFVNFATMNNTKRQVADQLAQDFAKSGLQIDAGTLTGSPLVQMMQARLAQSGLVGDALDNFRKELSDQVMKEYNTILSDLGGLAFENDYQAAEAIKDALKVEEVNLNTQNLIRLAEEKKAGRVSTQATIEPRIQQRISQEEAQNRLLETISSEPRRSTYDKGGEIREAAQEIKDPIYKDLGHQFDDLTAELSTVDAGPQEDLIAFLDNFINERQGSLLLGESTAEARVLRAAQNLRQQIATETGETINATISDLIKTRRTLADVADWQFGGNDFRTAYRGLVGELNAAIDRSLMQTPELRNRYLNLNADYELFKRTFENKNVAKVFERNNTNYETLYREFERNPDKLRSLEQILEGNADGERVLNEIKRGRARRIVEQPNLSEQDIVDLRQMLGPEHEAALADYLASRLQAQQPAQLQPRERLGLNVPAPQTEATTSLAGRNVSKTGTTRAAEGQRKKLYEELSKLKDTQLLQKMNSIREIKRMREVLGTTPEGKEVFKKLARYKLADLIDKKLFDNVGEQARLGRFASLLNDAKSREIVKELIGPEAYSQLVLLQKNSGRLAESAAKFLNASKSGTTLADVGLMGSAITGIITGNPWIAAPALGTIGGSRIAAYLLSDKVFLKELEKAIATNNPKKFVQAMKRMQPIVYKAIEEGREES